MYDNYPTHHVPRSNIVQRFFAQSAGAIALEIVMTLVIMLAADSALDLFGPFDKPAAAAIESAQALPAPPDALLPLREASLSYLAQRRYLAAEAVADVAAASDPADPANFELRGLVNLRSGDYAGAQSDFETVLDLSPHDFHGHNALCWTEGELGRFTSARRNCEAALLAALSPAQWASALENRCWLGVETRDYAAAKRDCQAVLNLLSDCHSEICALAHYNLGRVAVAQGQPQQALRHYNLAAHTGSAYANMYLDISQFYDRLGYQAAAKSSLAVYHQLSAADLTTR